MSAGEHRYFFSYARTDRDFVLKLAQELRAVGVDLWLDQLDILGGQRWDRAVEEALATCQGMIAVLSPASLASNNVIDEVSYALEEGKWVVPVLFQSCTIPFRLRRIQYIDFTGSYDTGFSQLLRALHVEYPAHPLQPKTPDNPVAQNVRDLVGETSMEAPHLDQPPVATTAPLESTTPALHEIQAPRFHLLPWVFSIVVAGMVLAAIEARTASVLAFFIGGLLVMVRFILWIASE
jgi:hypothetical protein